VPLLSLVGILMESDEIIDATTLVAQGREAEGGSTHITTVQEDGQELTTIIAPNNRGPYTKIPEAIRRRFVEYFKANDVSISFAARIFDLKESTARSIWKVYLKNGDAEAMKRGRSLPTKMTNTIKELVQLLVDTDPDLTLAQICTKVFERLHTTISISSVNRILTAIGYTMKLSRIIPEARNSEQQVESRFHYASMFMQERPVERGNIIWLDETGFNLHLRRRKGRSKIGERANVVVPNTQGKNISIVAAMNETGLLSYKAHYGAYTSILFAEWLATLGEHLGSLSLSNCWFVLDNVRFHHTALVASTVESLGFKLVFLPPYSPMLNPIELLFSKWKASVKTANMIYTRENLLQAIETSAQTISTNDCQGWIRECERNLSLCLQRLEFN
jgi:transposase